MKIPWRKQTRIIMNDIMLESFIKDLLSDRGTVWTYRSIFQEHIVDRNVKDIALVRSKILEWLDR